MQLTQGGGRLDSGKMGKVRLDLDLNQEFKLLGDILAQSFSGWTPFS